MDNNSCPPAFRRARGYRLYTASGERFLDLYLDGGRALMGYRPGKQILALKNVLSSGLTAPYSSVYVHRLKKLLSEMFPGSGVFLFSSQERARAALAVEGISDLTLWRPFTPVSGSEAFIPVVPAVLSGGITPVIIKDGGVELSEDSISPVYAAGMVRALFDLRSFMEAHDSSFWDRFDTLPGRVAGTPYWEIPGSPEEYEKIRAAALDMRIILPPNQSSPAILPGEFSSGEASKILKLGELF